MILPDWSHAYRRPEISGQLKSTPEHFRVDEILPFEPDGEGQHQLIHVEKRLTNTDWLARQLARHAGVPPRAVSYAGLKDRNALTTQWFSIDLAGKPAPDWSQLGIPEVRILAVHAHRRKLRRGALQGNRFAITLTELTGDLTGIDERLTTIQHQGVPNYFGEQRFGRDGDNLDKAQAMFSGEIQVKDRHRRSLYLSAARSFLFNQCLSRRVADGSWNRALEGEVMMLEGTRGFFVPERIDAEIHERLARMDIHPSGPLWGRGQSKVEGDVLALEQDCLSDYREWCSGLEKAGLEQDRRSLRLTVTDLQWTLSANQLELSFSLPAGCFATSVVREICQLGNDSPAGP